MDTKLFSKINKKKLIVNTIGVLLGIVLGYFYYKFYACNQGCPLNSSPYLSMIWGGLLGYLVSDMFKGASINSFLSRKKCNE